MEEARKQLLSYALFRPEGAIVLAIGILGAGLAALNVPWMPGEWWMWLAGGGAGFGGLVLSTLRDKRFFDQVVKKTFMQQFDLKRIRSRDLRATVQKALDYRSLIVEEIGRRDNPVLDEHLMDAARRTEDWIAQVYRLAEHVDTYETDVVIARDRETARQDMRKLQGQLRTALGTPVQMEIARTIEMKQAQVDAMERLDATINRARLQLDTTLTAMSTLYAQVKMLDSNKDVQSTRTQQLQSDMAEQVRSLQDTTSAMEELYRAGLARN